RRSSREAGGRCASASGRWRCFPPCTSRGASASSVVCCAVRATPWTPRASAPRTPPSPDRSLSPNRPLSLSKGPVPQPEPVPEPVEGPGPSACRRAGRATSGQGRQLPSALLDEGLLLSSRPTLDLLLAAERIIHAVELLGVDEPDRAPLSRVLGGALIVMVVFPHAKVDVGSGAAGVVRAVRAPQDVHPRHDSSVLRLRRRGRDARASVDRSQPR